MGFGNKIAEMRLKQNMSQEELASRLFVSRDLVSKWENNKRCPDREMMRRLSDVLSVDINFFESYEESLIRELSKCIPKENDISPEKFLILLNSFLEMLPERERNIFIRRYYFMETPEQIAEKYIMRTANVRLILSRIKTRLSKYIKERR